MKRVGIIVSVVMLAFGSLSAQVPLEYRLDGRNAFVSGKVDLIQQGQVRPQSKSVTSAVVLSLLIPGLGHWYADDFGTGKYFFIAEASSWLTFAAFRYRGDWLREDARSFASSHSGAQFGEKGDDFDVNIGNYASMDEYNQAQIRDRQISKLYAGAEYNWQWNSETNRQHFRELRIDSDQMYENAKFVIGALVINRVVAAFTAGRAAARSGSAEPHRGAWQMGATVQGGIQDAHGIELRLSKEF